MRRNRAGRRGGLRAAQIERGTVIKPGDVIVAIDAKPVSSVRRLQARLDAFNPGDTVRLGILRDGKRLTVVVTLVARP